MVFAALAFMLESSRVYGKHTNNLASRASKDRFKWKKRTDDEKEVADTSLDIYGKKFASRN